MAKGEKSATLSPVERTKKYLDAHHELRDVRWYTLLLFNAFEELRECTLLGA